MAVVVAATGVVGVPRVMEGQGDEGHRDLASMAGTSMKFDTSDAAKDKAAEFERMLPPGRFDELRMARPTDKWEMKTPGGVPMGISMAAADDDGTLPLVGAFVVRKGDQVGVVGVTHLKEDAKGADFCFPARQDCEVKRLPNGDESVTWRDGPDPGIHEKFGYSYTGVRSFDRRSAGKSWLRVTSIPLPNGSTTISKPPLSPGELRSLLGDERLLPSDTASE
ncbi:hypothetical protein ACH41E_21535 [Streptomyces sp. NPDC020412]|uniref:hypothetical protein n=1 Tax=Streptomyces sp. NPDC020412 TaxID=3365073 RepID=UPI0037A59981